MKEQRKRQWNKAMVKLPHLTRKGKTIRNLVCVVLLAGLCYLLLGAPPLTARQAFRRAERQNLVGPSEIIAAVSLKKLDLPEEVEHRETERFDREWTRMGFFAVGEQGDRLSYVWKYGFTYFNQVEKEGEVTFFPVWTCMNGDGVCEGGLILLQTEWKQAARAEVRICEYSGHYYNDLVGAGMAVGDGVFILPVVRNDGPVKEKEEKLTYSDSTASILIYDDTGTVIYHKTWTADEGGTYHEG